ncbi:hypothetical protein FITA111629_08520 [Filibacter tadaridae]|uniref:Uncharacterized protein n=1 Tax=Filibacter tadaridae TaxID=2483811 RepID=A0A3P5WX19_9BACL|nr:hypothetical protein [Filibacter tadaridae]VDC25992.1 hypothetical protein FILTAD_01409 [Filibacter tadaridae]
MSNEKKKDNEDMQATQKQTEADRKIKIREIYEKAVRTHGETLEKLSKN